MTQIEYEAKLKQIEVDYGKAKDALYLEYGLSQAKFKVGDVIKDERWIMLVDKVSASKSFGLPEPVYYGPELKKDLTPRKDGNRANIYGNAAELVKSNHTI